MTALDWVIVGFSLLLAAHGYRQGFIVGVLSFAGFVVGAFVGTRLGTKLLSSGSSSPYAPAFGLLGAVVAGVILAHGVERIAERLRSLIWIPGLGIVDGALGAVVSAAIGLGIVWIAAAVAAQAPGDTALRGDIQRSVILRALNSVLPPSGPILDALSRLDPLPSIAGPAPDVAAPTAGIASVSAVRAAAPSVVEVQGQACGLSIEGSGWVAAPDEVVTNAHVVAGERDTVVLPGGQGPALPATAIAFNPTEDIAVLRVPGLDEPPLKLSPDPRAGLEAAILGYPEDGPYDVQPGRIGQTQEVITENAYGKGSVHRLVTPLRGLVRPGNSGGPMVDVAGHVVTTVFAETTGGGPRGGYGVANKVVEGVLAHAGRPTTTGPCTE